MGSIVSVLASFVPSFSTMPASPAAPPSRLYLTAILLGIFLFVALVAGPFFQSNQRADPQSYNDSLLGLQAQGLAGQLLALLRNSTSAFTRNGGQWVAETSVSFTQTVTYSSSNVQEEEAGKGADHGDKEDGTGTGSLPGVSEQFLFPMVDERWGVGNQLQEFISAAYTARLLNRTLCLANPLAQPQEHKGGDQLSKVPK
jgi:hypothetical protein